MERLDPRVNAVRTDLADVALTGKVEAARFVDGERMRVAAPVAPLRHAPSNRASLLTEALLGEPLTVFETRPEGWAWVQLDADRYVGWMPREALAEPGPEPTHKVAALRTFAFAEPDIKSPPLSALPLGARVAVTGEAEDRNARYALDRAEGRRRRAASRAARRVRDRLDGGRRALPRRSLSLGRQDRARPRLLGAGRRSRCRPAASPRRATPTCRKGDRRAAVRLTAACRGSAAATSSSGAAMSASCATPRRCSTPTPTTWRLHPSRSPRRSNGCGKRRVAVKAVKRRG